MEREFIEMEREAVQLFKSGELERALELFFSILDECPSPDSTFYYNLSLALVKVGEIKQGLHALGKSLELDPDNYMARRLIEYIFSLYHSSISTDYWQELEEFLPENILYKNQASETGFIEAILEGKNGTLDSVDVNRNEGGEGTTTGAGWYRAVSTILIPVEDQAKGGTRDFIRDDRDAKHREPGNPPARGALNGLDTCKDEDGDCLARFKPLDGRHVTWYRGISIPLMTALSREELMSFLQECYENLTEIEKEKILVHSFSVATKLYDMADYEESAELLELLAYLEPQNIAILLQCGRALREVGTDDTLARAIEYFKQAVLQNSGNAVAWQELAVTFAIIGHFQKELYCLKRAFALGNEHADTARIRYLEGITAPVSPFQDPPPT